MVGIIILNYKNWKDTIDCLKSIFFVNKNNSFSIYIIDNASENSSLEKISDYLFQNNISHCTINENEKAEREYRTVLIQANKNRGFAAGNNIGIKKALEANHPYIFVLNNDTEIKENTVDDLVGFLQSDTSSVLAGPLVKKPNGSFEKGCARKRPKIISYFFRKGIYSYLFPKNKFIRKHYYNLQEIEKNKVPVSVDIISGSAMMFKKEYFEVCGLMDERTFLYLEEFIIHENIRNNFFSSWIVPKSEIIHKGGQSTKSIKNKSKINIELNSLKIYLKYYRNANLFIRNTIIANTRFGYFLYWLLKRK